MRSRLIALFAGLLFLASVVGVAVVSRSGGGGPLPKLALGANQQGEARADMAMMAPTTYKLADGVARPADKAPVYRFTTGEAQARRIADALGLKGKAVDKDGAWVIKDGDLALRLQRSGQWILVDEACGFESTVSSDGGGVCAISGGVGEMRSGVGYATGSAGSSEGSTGGGVITPNKSEPATTEPGATTPPDSVPPSMDCAMPECPPGSSCIQSCPEPKPMPEPVRPADLPTKGQARVAAEKILGGLGFDPDQGSIEVNDNFVSWAVTFSPQVDGEVTPSLSVQISIGPKSEVRSAFGWVADREQLGSYPLTTLANGVKRLNDGPAFAVGLGAPGGWAAYDSAPTDLPLTDSQPAGGAPVTLIAPVPPSPPEGCSPSSDGKECATPMPVDPDCAKIGAPTECSAPNCNCGPPDFKPIVVTLTKVKMGATVMPSSDLTKSAYLVPAFVFANDDGVQDLAVMAIPDDLIEKAPEPKIELQTDQFCETSQDKGTDQNASLNIQACTSGTAFAGKVVNFKVVVDDADAAIYQGGCTTEPEVDFGDANEPTAHAVCMADCAALSPGAPPAKKETGHLERGYDHIYATPGVYEVKFSFTSSGPCGGNPYGSTAGLSMKVTVA